MRKIVSKLPFVGKNISKPVNSALPYVAGIVQVGKTLTAGNGSWSGKPTAFSYQWVNSSTGNIAGQTSGTYVAGLGDSGFYVTVKVTATNAAGSTTATSWNLTKISDATAAPVLSGAPTINSDAPQVGVVLSSSNGTWTNLPTSYTYQWFAAGTAITGATTNSYTPVAADIGKQLTVNVNAINGAGSSLTAMTAPTFKAVLGAVPVLSVVPAITGTKIVGQTLTCTTGTWTKSPTSYAYQWNNEGSPISGATSSTYVLQTSDLGALITVAVTARDSVGASAPAQSALAGPVISTTAYYVANAGSDGNTGTSPGAPWKTIGHVNGFAFPPGSSVLFNRGDVWREQLSPTASGSSGSPIVFDAYGTGNAPIIKGSVAASTTGDWTLISGNLWKSTTAFQPAALSTVMISIASPGVVTWTAHGRPNGQAVAFSTTGTLPTGITAGVGYYVVAATANTFEIAATPGGASINTSGAQSGVHSAGANGLPHNNANDVGNLIWVSGGATQVGTTSYTLMTGQTDTNLTTQGQYYFNTSDWTVHVYSVGNPSTTMPELELAIDKVIAYFNNISYITIQNVTLLYGAGSALMFHKASNMIARDMTMAWCGGGNDGGINLRAGNGADVQLVGSNFLIERCLIQQCYDAGLTIQPLVSNQPIGNVTFRNNVITNTTQGLFQLISFGATISNVSIYNNTGYNLPSWSEGQRWGAGGTSESGEQYGLYHSDSGGSTMTNYNNFNNVYAGLGTSCSIRHPKPTTVWQGSGNMLLDYNLWSRANATAPIVCLVPLGGNPFLTTWAAGDTPPQEVHGQVGLDPMFANQASGYFAPATGSPLLNAGTNLYSAGVVWDINHNPRPSSGPFTIGAFQ